MPVYDGKMDRAGSADIDDGARHAPGGFDGKFSFFEARQLDVAVFESEWAVNGAAARGSVFAAGFVAVEGIGGEAEEVFHGEGDAGGEVLLELAERDHHVGVLVGVIQVQRREHAAAIGHFEVGVFFAAAEVAGVLVFDFAHGVEGVHIPVGEGKSAFELRAALIGFDEADASGAGLEQRGGERGGGVVVSHVGLADGTVFVVGEVGAGEVQLDGAGFTANERAEAAEQIERLVVGLADGGAVGFAGNDGDFSGLRAGSLTRRRRRTGSVS